MTTPRTNTLHAADVSLGAAIRLRRRSLGMSQHTLAEACGISFQQVQKYESGMNGISMPRLVQIARALTCRVVDLMQALDAQRLPTSGNVDPFLTLRTPGALELLELYTSLNADARLKLVHLLRTFTSSSNSPE